MFLEHLKVHSIRRVFASKECSWIALIWLMSSLFWTEIKCRRLHDLETNSGASRVWAFLLCKVEALCYVFAWLGEKSREFQGFVMKALILFMRALLSWPNSILRALHWNLPSSVVSGFQLMSMNLYARRKMYALINLLIYEVTFWPLHTIILQ